MGLSTSHYKLTFEPQDENDFLLIEDWDESCNVPLKHYARFITDVKEYDFNKSILIVNSLEKLNRLETKDWFSSKNFLNVFINTNENLLNKEINSFIAAHGLDKYEKIRVTTEVGGIEYDTLSFGEEVTKKGIYFNVVGDQSKWMSTKFYDTFKQECWLWGKKEDFELAYNCVGGEWYIQTFGLNEVNSLKKKFKRDFIDNFVFGQSLLSVSF
ncbi:MAG: hypothetical protein SVU94_11670 [Bacteroidota bacterium]|nr:hypothetical protein [Bacteroidota bacterium]